MESSFSKSETLTKEGVDGFLQSSGIDFSRNERPSPENIEKFRNFLATSELDRDAAAYGYRLLADRQKDVIDEIRNENLYLKKSLQQNLEQQSQKSAQRGASWDHGDDLRERLKNELHIKGTTEEILEQITEIDNEYELFLANLLQRLGLPLDTTSDEILSYIDSKADILFLESGSPLRKEPSKPMIRNASGQFRLLHNNITELEQTVENKDNEIEELKSLLEECEGNIEEQEATIQDLQKQIRELEDQNSAHEDKAAREEIQKLEHQNDIEVFEETKKILLEKVSNLEERCQDLEHQIEEKDASYKQTEDELNITKDKLEKLQIEFDAQNNTDEVESAGRRLRKHKRSKFLRKVFDGKKETGDNNDDEKKDQSSSSDYSSDDSESENQEHESLLRVVSEYAQKIIDQTDELAKEVSNRNRVVEIVFQQERIIDALQHQLELYKGVAGGNKHIGSTTQETDMLEQLMNKTKSLSDHKLTEKYQKNVQEIAFNKGSLDERLLKVIECLANGCTELAQYSDSSDKEINQMNARLIAFIRSELTFIETKFDEAMDKENKDEQAVLRENLSKTVDFLKENELDFSTQQYLFEFMDTDPDPMKLADTINRILEVFPDPTQANPKELYCALAQAIAVNAMLRQFCTQNMRLAEQQTKELTHARQENRELQETLTEQYEKQINDLQETLDDETMKREEAEEALQNAMDMLRAHIDEINTKEGGDVSNTLSVMLDALSTVEESVPSTKVPDNYNKNLEEKLQKTLNELNELKKMVPRNLTGRGSSSDDDVNLKLEDSSMKLHELSLDVEDLKLEIDEANLKLQKAQIQLDNKDNVIFSLEDKVKELQNDIDERDDQIRAEQREGEKKAQDAELAALEKHKEREEILRQSQEAQIDMLQKQIKQKENELKRANDLVADKERRISALEELKAALKEDQKRRTAEQRKSEKEAAHYADKLKRQLADVKAKLVAAQLEAKLSETRVKDVQESAQREKTRLLQQLKVQSMQQDNQIKSRAEELKKTSDDEIKEMLIFISHTFKEYADFNNPISRQSCKEILRQVRKQIDLYNTQDPHPDPSISKIIIRLRETSQEAESWRNWAKLLAGTNDATDDELRDIISHK